MPPILGSIPAAAGEGCSNQRGGFSVELYATPWNPWTLVETLDKKEALSQINVEMTPF
jgi:hypothetical protein